MAGTRVVTLRPRRSFVVLDYFEAHQELVFELVNVFIAFVQFLACFGFFEDATNGQYVLACWVFFFTSILNIGMALGSAFEARKHYKGDVSEEDRGMCERELIANMIYILANIAFAAGSIYFLPELNEHDERRDITMGSHLFLAGSALFGAGTFVNSLGIKVDGRFESMSMNEVIVCLSLQGTTIGCYCFFAGTFFYYPEVYADARGGPSCTATTQWNLLNIGTSLYVLGCGLFMFSSVLNACHADTKRRISLKSTSPNLTSAQMAETDKPTEVDSE